MNDQDNIQKSLPLAEEALNVPPVKPPKKSKEEVTVSEVLNEVQTDIDNLQDAIEKKFEEKRQSLLVAKPRKEYFICKNKFWDLLFQKLFAQIISVKIWIIALITVLLSLSLISNIQFASILGIIMGLKGTFQVAGVWKKNGNKDLSAMDKT